MNIVNLKWDETIPIRHEVLWPNKPASFCKVDGDESARHYGVKVKGNLVCVASVYLDSESARLRKFATLEHFQNQGLGTLLLNHMLEDMMSLNVHRFYLMRVSQLLIFMRDSGFQLKVPDFIRVM